MISKKQAFELFLLRVRYHLRGRKCARSSFPANYISRLVIFTAYDWWQVLTKFRRTPVSTHCRDRTHGRTRSDATFVVTRNEETAYARPHVRRLGLVFSALSQQPQQENVSLSDDESSTTSPSSSASSPSSPSCRRSAA